MLIIGAGFAGLAALAGFDGTGVKVTLVDRHNYTTFQPLLYQVATAGLDAGDVAFSARQLVRHRPWAEFTTGEVVGIDWSRKEALLSDGRALAFDFLILAAGAVTNYFGVSGAEENSLAIYTLEDALEVRARLYSQLEAADSNPTDGALTFVVVGGGATGVEMAGALAELLHASLERDYPHLRPSFARVLLVERQDGLLGAFDESLGRYTVKELSRRGVEVRLGESVKEIRPGEVQLGSGEVVKACLIVWGAGVAASPLGAKIDAELTRAGRIVVADDLRFGGRPDAFAVGDIAAAPMAPGGEIAPQLAQPAIQAGAHAAKQILRLIEGKETEAFHYRDKGTMATIGRHAAVAQLNWGIDLRGAPAWIAWLALHLVTLLGMRNRLAVLVNWAWRYLSWWRGPRLIVGAETGRSAAPTRAQE